MAKANNDDKYKSCHTICLTLNTVHDARMMKIGRTGSFTHLPLLLLYMWAHLPKCSSHFLSSVCVGGGGVLA